LSGEGERDLGKPLTLDCACDVIPPRELALACELGVIQTIQKSYTGAVPTSREAGLRVTATVSGRIIDGCSFDLGTREEKRRDYVVETALIAPGANLRCFAEYSFGSAWRQSSVFCRIPSSWATPGPHTHNAPFPPSSPPPPPHKVVPIDAPPSAFTPQAPYVYSHSRVRRRPGTLACHAFPLRRGRRRRPWNPGGNAAGGGRACAMRGRGLHSSTSQLNLSRVCHK